MNRKEFWLILLVLFAGINVFAFVFGTLGGLGVYLRDLGPWGILATSDLLIALIIGIGWMWSDARRRGITPLPYLLLTLATGSLGLLVYLTRFGIPEGDSRSAPTGG